jgi:hypothetical protein
MLRLSALAEDWPAVAEVTIDTLLIGGPGEGVTAVAPAVRIAPVDDGGSDRLNDINRSIIYVIDPRETACPAPRSGRSGDSCCPARRPVPPARRGRRSRRSTAAATAPGTGIIRWIRPRRCSPWGRRWDTGSSRSTGPDTAPRTASSGTACGQTARRRSFSTSSTRSGPAATPAPPSSLSAIPWAPCSPAHGRVRACRGDRRSGHIGTALRLRRGQANKQQLASLDFLPGNSREFRRALFYGPGGTF